MISLHDVFDAYGRKARLFPAFLALLPIFAIVGVYSSVLEFSSEHIVWAVVSAAALYFVADVARSRGKAVERMLIAEWGGYPSKHFLRHVDQSIDPHTKGRYHRAAEKLILDAKMPSAEQEEEDSKDADSRYESVVRYLLANTRDTARFGLLYKENINYGFRRNMYGLRPSALLILAGSTLFVLWQARHQILGGSMPQQLEMMLLVCAVIDLCAWVSLVTKKGVRESSEEYARQLLSSLDQLKPDPPSVGA